MTDISLTCKHVMRGPTSKFYLTTTARPVQNAEGSIGPFVLADFANVWFKVKCGPNNEHIYMLKIKRILEKCDAIHINVTCDAYSKKWCCSDMNSDWKNIGPKVPSPGKLAVGSGNYAYVSEIEVITAVYMSKPKFPKLYDDCDLTDFTLSTTDGDVAVHKACLAVCSPVFKAMFTGTWKEAKENKVEIKDYSLQTVQHLKDFLYLGTLPNVGLRPLIALAALYSISDLKKECARKLAETVQPEDLYSLHEFACANNIPELTYALSQLTPDRVIDQCHIIQKKKDENQIK